MKQLTKSNEGGLPTCEKSLQITGITFMHKTVFTDTVKH